MFRILWSVIYVCLLSLPGHAQNISDHATIADAPPWVQPAQADRSSFQLGHDDAVEYLLSDRQVFFEEAQSHYYLRNVKRLNTSAAVEENSIVSVDFDPAYERVIFHSLRLWRGDEAIDLLDLSGFDLYRVETDRDRLIYNGTLQLSYLLPDLRVGDVVDYSVSVVGKNPALGPHFSYSVYHEYGVPVRHLRSRVLFPAGTNVYSKAFTNAPAPQRQTRDGRDIYAWDAKDVPGVDVEDNRPADHFGRAETDLSSFENWAEVGRYFATHYDVSGPKPEGVAEVAAKIAARHHSDAARLRAALEFVQREVRYLGIELGAGGYIPRRPEQVLARRFGDCKDMVMLLTSLLDELGIKAAPLLVDLDNKGAIRVWQPSYNAFDHVIAVAWVDDKPYFLDPTRGEQLGDLEHLQQGNFGKGVIIAPDSPGMIDAEAPMPAFFKVIKDRYITTPERDSVQFINTSDYYMHEADSMLSWVRSSGLEEVDREFLKYYQRIYPGLEQSEPLKMEVSENIARVRFIADYRIPEGWSRDADNEAIRNLVVRPSDLLADLPDFDGTPRQTAFAISHPKRVRHDIEVVLDDTWGAEESVKSHDHPAFAYERKERFRDGTLVQQNTFVTKSDRIEPADFKATMASLNDIEDYSGLSLTEDQSAAGLLDGVSEEDFEMLFWGYIALIVLASLLGAYLTRNRDAGRLDEQVFYPVSLTKFIILSAVTLGIYQIYWTYRNWQWIRIVQEEQISPFWRTVFSGFTNFSLFPRFAKTADKGMAWFGPVAVPLAVLVLLSQVLDRYTQKATDVPDWLEILALLTVLLPVPAAMQVLRLNRDKPEQIAMNSRFSWPVCLMILGFAPVMVAAIWGITL